MLMSIARSATSVAITSASLIFRRCVIGQVVAVVEWVP